MYPESQQNNTDVLTETKLWLKQIVGRADFFLSVQKSYRTLQTYWI